MFSNIFGPLLALGTLLADIYRYRVRTLKSIIVFRTALETETQTRAPFNVRRLWGVPEMRSQKEIIGRNIEGGAFIEFEFLVIFQN